MEEITALTTIDYYSLFVAVFTILIGLKTVVLLFEWVVEKLGLETKWMRRRREERELLVKTSQNLSNLQEKHEKDVQQSIIHDKKIQDDLSLFIVNMKDAVAETQEEIKRFAENRVHDREQSLQIQKDLTDSIKSIIDRNSGKDIQINNLMIAQREVLADRINQKYKHYISIKGIPEDEVDEFTNLHAAYKGVGGNHSGDAKFEYCINHLPVIPVETKLITNK